MTRNGLGLSALALLAACGGGGGSDSPPVTPPVSTSVTIAGTAVEGAALPGAAVSAKCVGGTGAATTAPDGKYTLTITSAALPCALKVVGTNGATFHSLLAGSGGGSFTANLSPLTELLVAKAAGVAPGSYFTNFAAGTAPSAATVTQAIDALKSIVAGLIDLTGINPLTDALVVGNPLDQKIDTLVSGLAAAQTTLAAVTSAIVANPTSPEPVKSILSPAASSCAALHSGNYRVINPYETDPAWKHHVMALNAATLTATFHDGSSVTLVSNGDCKFTIDNTDFTDTVLVAPTGILVVYSQSKTTPSLRTMTVGLPEQALPLSELAGTWNTVDWDPQSGSQIAGYVGSTPVITVNGNGEVTAISRCLGLNPCVPDTGPFGSFNASASGGFERVENAVSVAQLYLYKTPAGRAAFMLVNDSGEAIFGTRQEAIASLPAVASFTNFREFQLNGNGTLSTLLDQKVTVTGTDATTSTVTRIRESDGRVDTLSYNKPQAGMRYRAPNSCTIGGVASNCSETAQLLLQGMGITLSVSVGTSPNGAFLSVSVNKPAV